MSDSGQSAAPSVPAQTTVTLSEEERTELLSWLEQWLKNKRLEEHRTDALSYKVHVQRQEKLLEALIAKFRR